MDPDEALVELAGDLEPGRAVDLGAGEGRNSLWLARAGWDVTAVDLSSVALDRLGERAASEGLDVTTVAGDIEQHLGGGFRYDLVVMANIHTEPTLRTSLFAAATGAVDTGGHLFVVGHHLDSLGIAGPPDPERLYTEEMLAGALAGLEILRLYREDHAHGDLEVPAVNLVAWAVRPAR